MTMTRHSEMNSGRSFVLCCVFFAVVPRPLHGHDLDVPAGAKVHFMGDSISGGWGFGQFDYPATLNRIQDIATLLMQDNLASPPVINLIPDGPPQSGAVLAARIQENVVGPNDWIFYEDAGDHFGSYHAYRKRLADLAAASAGANRRLFVMTMFEYDPSYSTNTLFDAPTSDEPTKSINDAIREEATAQGLSLIDMNKGMDDLRAYMLKNGFGSPVHGDGIHPNVFGNLMMAFVELRALGADLDSWKLDSVEKLFLHPEAGGEVSDLRAAPWSWPKDLTDRQRRKLVREIRRFALADGLIRIENGKAGKE
jgi:hypothetical protein